MSFIFKVAMGWFLYHLEALTAKLLCFILSSTLTLYVWTGMRPLRIPPSTSRERSSWMPRILRLTVGLTACLLGKPQKKFSGLATKRGGGVLTYMRLSLGAKLLCVRVSQSVTNSLTNRFAYLMIQNSSLNNKCSLELSGTRNWNERVIFANKLKVFTQKTYRTRSTKRFWNYNHLILILEISFKRKNWNNNML